MKESDRKAWIKKIDEVFSKWLRLSQSDSNGIVLCFTCGTRRHYLDQMQDGHYVSRNYLALRWDEENNHIQCYYCNMILKGNYPMYSLKMVEKYGPDILQKLEIKKNNLVKWTLFEYKLFFDIYNNRLKELEKKFKSSKFKF